MKRHDRLLTEQNTPFIQKALKEAGVERTQTQTHDSDKVRKNELSLRVNLIFMHSSCCSNFSSALRPRSSTPCAKELASRSERFARSA